MTDAPVELRAMRLQARCSDAPLECSRGARVGERASALRPRPWLHRLRNPRRGL
jgi:hypothetical protein